MKTRSSRISRTLKNATLGIGGLALVVALTGCPPPEEDPPPVDDPPPPEAPEAPPEEPEAPEN